MALAVAAAAFAQPASGEGSADARVRLLAADLDARLAARAPHADPAEVAGLLHHEIAGKPARFHLVVLDLRSEADFNLFHLPDARRTTLDRLRGEEGRALARPEHDHSVVVAMSNDEREAEAAWRLLVAQKVAHPYVLAGGANLWVELFREGRRNAAPAPLDRADDRLRHEFRAALGERWPFARPPEPVYRALVAPEGGRSFTPKVRPVAKTPTATGGCG
jgi:hypothetical protein